MGTYTRGLLYTLSFLNYFQESYLKPNSLSCSQVSLDLIAYMNPPEPTYTQYHSTATSSLLSQPYSSAYLQPSTPSTHHPNNHQNINKPLTFDDPIFASSPGMTSILPRFTHTDVCSSYVFLLYIYSHNYKLNTTFLILDFSLVMAIWLSVPKTIKKMGRTS